MKLTIDLDDPDGTDYGKTLGELLHEAIVAELRRVVKLEVQVFQKRIAAAAERVVRPVLEQLQESAVQRLMNAQVADFKEAFDPASEL